MNGHGESDNVRRSTLTVVVPAFNEEEVIFEFHETLARVLDGLDLDCDVLYVNDGSTDGTVAKIEMLRQRDARVGYLDLSRNFGKEIAMSAGLDAAEGDAVVVIDADLQDPPELIPTLVERWREGYDNVYAQRTSRDGETFLKKLTAHLFYRSIGAISHVHIPPDTGDFRLLSRRAVDAVCEMRERHRFMKGLFAWVGYPSVAVRYQRQPRKAGGTKWDYWKLWNFALEGITSFTDVPLKFATYIGLATSFSAFVYGLVIVFKTLAFGDPVAGYPSLMTVILFLGGIQLMTLGVIGEYLGRTFSETKRRPLYLVKTVAPRRDVKGKVPISADS